MSFNLQGGDIQTCNGSLKLAWAGNFVVKLILISIVLANIQPQIYVKAVNSIYFSYLVSETSVANDSAKNLSTVKRMIYLKLDGIRLRAVENDASVIEQFYKPKQKKFVEFKFNCNPLTGSQNIVIKAISHIHIWPFDLWPHDPKIFSNSSSIVIH